MLLYPHLNIIIESESGDKSNAHIIGVCKNLDSQKGVHKAADLQKWDPRGKNFGNLWNIQLYAQLCEENDKNFHQLLLYIEVEWLSKDLRLINFFSLFDTVSDFLDAKDPILKQKLITQ